MKSTTTDDFKTDVIERSHDDIVLLDVWADWCMPCKAQLPILEQLDTDLAFYNYASVVKLDADANQDKVAELGVRSIPTLIWFVNGVEVHRETGLKSRKDLLEITKRFI